MMLITCKRNSFFNSRPSWRGVLTVDTQEREVISKENFQEHEEKDGPEDMSG